MQKWNVIFSGLGLRGISWVKITNFVFEKERWTKQLGSSEQLQTEHRAALNQRLSLQMISGWCPRRSTLSWTLSLRAARSSDRHPPTRWSCCP